MAVDVWGEDSKPKKEKKVKDKKPKKVKVRQKTEISLDPYLSGLFFKIFLFGGFFGTLYFFIYKPLEGKIAEQLEVLDLPFSPGFFTTFLFITFSMYLIFWIFRGTRRYREW